MKKLTIGLIIGVISGYLLAHIVHTNTDRSNDAQSNETALYLDGQRQIEVTNKHPNEDSVSSGENDVSETGQVSNGASSEMRPLDEPSETVSATGSLQDESNQPLKAQLPAQYGHLVAAPELSPEDLRPDELHDIFDAWAYSIESSVNSFLATNDISPGTVIDYVECRTNYCEFAGYVNEGYDHGAGQIFNAMRNSGWWQLGEYTTTVGNNSDGTYKFVVIILREQD